MRRTFLVSVLVALAAAFPRPQDQNDDPSDFPEAVSSPFPTPTIPVRLSTSLNIPITSVGLPTPIVDPEDPDETSTSSKSRRKPHWEPIPIFTKECKCDLKTAQYPCWATDALQRCNYEENFSGVCYMEAAGGCPTPTRRCADLFLPTPKPGRHPCDIRPGEPPLTTAAPLPLPTSIPAIPSINVTLPSGNVTLPVISPTANVTLPVTLTL